MGFVRELNEGVKRIYSSMDEYKLEEPKYTDENDIVTLKLTNMSYSNNRNISRGTLEKITENYKTYNPTKKDIIDILLFHGDLTLDIIEKKSRSGLRAIQNNIKELINDGIVVKYSEKIRDRDALYGIIRPLSEHNKNKQ
jgi:ATP-dependent DNA helicase RecG